MTGVRLLVAALLGAGAAVAACPSGTTHIVDTLTAADGSAKAGAIYVTGPTGVASVARSTVTVTIGAGGAVDFCLAGGVAYVYDAEYRLTVGGRATPSYTERWFVPARPVGSVTVTQLWGGSGVPYYLVSPQQMANAGLDVGQMWIWDGQSWIPGAPLFADTLTAQLGDLPMRGNTGWERLPAAVGWLKWTGTAFLYSAPTQTDVGLPNVNNTSDTNKPVSTATQAALDLKLGLHAKADTAGAADSATTAAGLTGTPALPNGTTGTTQAPSDGSTKVATDAYVDAMGATKIPSSSAPVGAIVGTTDAQVVTDKTLGRTETAGAGGVTANLLAAKDTSNPTKYVLPAAGGCGSGIAASTVSSAATFFLYASAGQSISAVADGAITAGHLLTGGSSTPGRVADTGQTARASVPSSTCIVGVAKASATVGQTLSIVYDGPGSFGSGSFSDDGATITAASGRNLVIGATVLDAISGLLLPVTTSTSGPVTVTATGLFRNNATGAITFNLPTITTTKVGMRFCFRNAVGKLGAITIQAPSSTFIDLGGANGTSAGTLVSDGALGDCACLVAVSTTQYEADVRHGGWTNN